MRRPTARFACFVLLVAGLNASAGAQETDTKQEVWPELDVFVTVSEKVRFFFLASVTRARETRNNTEGEVGAHVDYLMCQKISLRAGYRYSFDLAGGEPFAEHRIVLEQTVRKPLPHGMLLTDRIGQDLRWVNGNFSARLKNRVAVEKEFRLRERAFVPYGSAEIFYDTRFSTFNRNRLVAGVQITLKKREPWLINLRRQRVLEIYYLRQNDSRSQPKHVNVIGVTFSIYL